jgi:hypothetical protein
MKPGKHPRLCDFLAGEDTALRAADLPISFGNIGNRGTTASSLGLPVPKFCEESGNDWEQAAAPAVGTDISFPLFPIAGPAAGTLNSA